MEALAHSIAAYLARSLREAAEAPAPAAAAVRGVRVGAPATAKPLPKVKPMRVIMATLANMFLVFFIYFFYL